MKTVNTDAIAPQCPFAGGRAVFYIRGVLRELGDTTIYDDEAACDEGNFSRKAKTAKDIKDYYSLVIPNPANNQCKINFSLPDDKYGILLINDLKGQEISKYNIPPNSTEIKIDLRNFNCGSYVYSIRVEGEKTMHGKLTIIR